MIHRNTTQAVLCISIIAPRFRTNCETRQTGLGVVVKVERNPTKCRERKAEGRKLRKKLIQPHFVTPFFAFRHVPPPVLTVFSGLAILRPFLAPLWVRGGVQKETKKGMEMNCGWLSKESWGEGTQTELYSRKT